MVGACGRRRCDSTIRETLERHLKSERPPRTSLISLGIRLPPSDRVFEAAVIQASIQESSNQSQTTCPAVASCYSLSSLALSARQKGSLQMIATSRRRGPWVRPWVLHPTFDEINDCLTDSEGDERSSKRNSRDTRPRYHESPNSIGHRLSFLHFQCEEDRPSNPRIHRLPARIERL